MHIFHSDDDLLDRKHLDPIFKQLFTLSFILYFYRRNVQISINLGKTFLRISPIRKTVVA